MSSTTSSAMPSATTDNGQSGGSSGPSSPLLFFVALGFGVVFTNLWIIVGVKYCFRYNQRNRARFAGEDPDGVDLGNVPRQRRRREKKLMTIDEVNEKFPLVKYKTWRSTRADQGLPTAGGITNAASRPASIRHQTRDSHDDGELQEKEPKTPTTTINEKMSIAEHGEPEQISEIEPATSSGERPTTGKSTIVVPDPVLLRSASNDEPQEDADRIETAIPAEQLPDPGDTCAICIDTIEDDDDIRGLTCGHAFHASCVDPWLTSRRACCPLCKADYYVPKPRPEGTQNDTARVNQNPPVPQGPFAIMSSGRSGYGHYRRGPFGSLSAQGFFPAHAHAGRNRPSWRGNIQAETPSSAPEISSDQTNSQSWRERIRMPTMPALSRIRRGRGNEPGEQPAEATNPTPGQLEAGDTRS